MNDFTTFVAVSRLLFSLFITFNFLNFCSWLKPILVHTKVLKFVKYVAILVDACALFSNSTSLIYTSAKSFL